MHTATVVGAGPNGLVAAIDLARRGLRVTVLEAADAPGGGLRAAAPLVEGVHHDAFAAVLPLAVASPGLRRFRLERHGLRFAWPEVQLAHPLAHGEAAVLHRGVGRTAAGLGRDAGAWGRLFTRHVRAVDRLLPDLLGRPGHAPTDAVEMARFGMHALSPAALVWSRFRGDRARALFAGIAAHAGGRLDRPGSAVAAMMLGMVGQSTGWPVAVGGTRALADALIAELAAVGGRIELNRRVTTLDDVGEPDLLLLDLAPGHAAELLAGRQPLRRAVPHRRFRHGIGAFKLDLVTEGEVPWTAPAARRAGTVHLGGTAEEIAAAEADCAAGRMPARPFVLVAQQHLADPSRSRGDLHPLWAYAHVPNGYAGDATEAILGELERAAPGIRGRITAARATGPAALEAANANLVGGDIAGGAVDLRQLLARPHAGPNPYDTGVPGVWLCSASTSPGGGVHGMCGVNAAAVALRGLRAGRRFRP